MKKFNITLYLLILLVNASLVVPVGSFAISPELKKEIKEEMKEKPASKPGFMQGIENKLGRAAILNGTILTKSGTTLTVTKDGKTYSVQTDAKTQLRRRFWGKSTLDEMQVGDSVNIHGKWTDDSQTVVQAVLIRDLSVQKRFGTFFGTVTSVTPTGWVIDTIRRGSQTVTVSSSTKFVNRSGATISQSDILAGQKIRVKGLWNNKTNIISEVTHIKDFSLPPVPKISK